MRPAIRAAKGNVSSNRDEHQVEEPLDEPDRLFRPPGLAAFLQDVAHRARNEGRIRSRFRRLEQRDELETHLPPPEGIGFDDEDIRLHRLQRSEKAIPPQRLELFAQRFALGIDKLGERGVARADRRQLDDLDLGFRKAPNRYAAAHQRHLDPGFAQCGGDAADPRQMADAEKMLDIDQHSHEWPLAPWNSRVS
jgi:hypothetical protein